MYCRQAGSLPEQHAEHRGSDDDGSRAASSRTNSMSESGGRARNSSNSAEDEQSVSAESEPTKRPGSRRSCGLHRTDRLL